MRIFVRYGELPENGRSYNWDADAEEPGVSVYAADLDDDSLCVLVPDADCAAALMMALEGRPLYRAEGERLAQRGTDGEPLLTGVTLTPLEIASSGYCIDPEA